MKPLTLAFTSALMVSSNLVLAQDDTALGEAYQRAARGLSEFKSGHYAEALEDYSRAFAIVRLPALAVHMARANAKLGRYKLATDLYAQAIELGNGVGDPDVQARARHEAQLELLALRPQIPKVFVRVSGTDRAGVSLSVDGVLVQKSAYESGWLVDPGTHHVVATRGSQRLEQWTTLTAGQSRELNFTFAPHELQETGPNPDGTRREAVRTQASAIRNASVLSLAVGGTGLLIWGSAGLVALNKSDHLKSLHCGGQQLPCPAHEVSDYDHWKTVSAVGFYTGAAGLLAAAAFYFSQPSAKKSRDSAASVLPWVAFGKAGVEGRF